MKTTIQPQRAYITRRTDLDNSVYVQEEAARILDQKVSKTEADEAEIKRLRQRASTFRDKQKSRKANGAPPGWLIAKLGGKDPISEMLRDRHLTERQGLAALSLRHYRMAEVAGLRSAEITDFTEGGVPLEMIDKVLKLDIGRRARDAGRHAVPDLRWQKPSEKMIIGDCRNMKQAARMVCMREERARPIVQGHIVAYLDGAAAIFSSFA